MSWTMAWDRRGPELRRAITCEACGQPFTCEASGGSCWCKQVELTESERAGISTRYRDCLCPECLKKHQTSQRTGAP